MNRKILGGLLIGAFVFGLGVSDVHPASASSANKVKGKNEQMLDGNGMTSQTPPFARNGEGSNRPDPPKDKNGNPLPPPDRNGDNSNRPDPPKDKDGNYMPPPDRNGDNSNRPEPPKDKDGNPLPPPDRNSNDDNSNRPTPTER